MTYLLDVNVLVALAWPNHFHHEAAHAWFAAHRSRGWATCPVTQSGFVRFSSNPRVIPEARTPAEAVLLLRKVVAVAGHVFWSDDVSFVEEDAFVLEKLLGYRQVTDAHLLALALRRGGRLVTFDGGVRELASGQGDGVVELVEETR